MSNKWYYQEYGEEFGPYTATELREFARIGTIQPDTYVRKGVDGRWASACRVKGLFNYVSESQPPNHDLDCIRSQTPSAERNHSLLQQRKHFMGLRSLSIFGLVILVSLIATGWYTKGQEHARQIDTDKKILAESMLLNEERIAKLESEKLAQEQRIHEEETARLDADKRAREAERKAKEAERKVQAEQDQLAIQEAERKTQEERFRLAEQRLQDLAKQEAEARKREDAKKKAEANRTLQVVVGSDREENMNFTTAFPAYRQALIENANSALKNVKARVTDDGKLITTFDIDLAVLQKSTESIGAKGLWLSFQFSLYDKNGQYLAHFNTKERFSADHEGISTILKISPEDGSRIAKIPLTFRRLAKSNNQLVYGVNLRDLRETHALKFGVNLHSIYAP